MNQAQNSLKTFNNCKHLLINCLPVDIDDQQTYWKNMIDLNKQGFVPGTSTKLGIFSMPIELSNETISGKYNQSYFDLLEEKDIVNSAFIFFKNKKLSAGITNQAISLLVTIKKYINSLNEIEIDMINDLPELNTFIQEDGSILIEWIFGKARIGFNIEIEPKECTWFLATKPELADVNALGALNEHGSDKIIKWLINFVLIHYDQIS